MPNTLAHYGIHTLTSKGIFRPADIKWIGLGCLIPDLPWITQRLIHPLSLVDPVDLHIYVLIQATLFFSLLLSAAICLQVKESGRIFLLLAFNCFIHLLLDSTQIKWANGTHLLAPFSWQLTNFDWYWPEQLPTLLLTLAGLAIFPIFVWQDRHREIYFILDKKRQVAGTLLLAAYLLLPLLMFNGPMQANNHFSATLKSKTGRTGNYIELDRAGYRAGTKTLTVYSGEQLQVSGGVPEHDGTVSVQGQFTDNNTILISRYHVHSPLRDLYSKIGIIMLLVAWLVALFGKRIRISQ